MFRGRVRFTVPMIYSIGFIMTFRAGRAYRHHPGQPAVDYQVHNTLFLVAHFHNMPISGRSSACLLGTILVPEGVRLSPQRTPGDVSVRFLGRWLHLAFFPLYVLGPVAWRAHRRRHRTCPTRRWKLRLPGRVFLLAVPWSLVVQLWVSIRERDANRVFAGDPWDGRGLEWSISAPPPEYNFALTPQGNGRDPFYESKRRDDPYPPPQRYEDISMPKNTSVGPVLGVLGAATAFGLVWHMWWLAIVGILRVIATLIARSFVRDTHRIIPAAEVEHIDRAWRTTLAAVRAIRARSRQHPPTGAWRRFRMSASEVNHAGINLGNTETKTQAKAGVDVFGFWVFLMSDAVIFALLFATYGVMLSGTAGGPTPAQEYRILPAFIETAILLTSSFTYGMASVAMSTQAGLDVSLDGSGSPWFWGSHSWGLKSTTS